MCDITPCRVVLTAKFTNNVESPFSRKVDYGITFVFYPWLPRVFRWYCDFIISNQVFSHWLLRRNVPLWRRKCKLPPYGMSLISLGNRETQYSHSTFIHHVSQTCPLRNVYKCVCLWFWLCLCVLVVLWYQLYVIKYFHADWVVLRGNVPLWRRKIKLLPYGISLISLGNRDTHTIPIPLSVTTNIFSCSRWWQRPHKPDDPQ